MFFFDISFFLSLATIFVLLLIFFVFFFVIVVVLLLRLLHSLASTLPFAPALTHSLTHTHTRCFALTVYLLRGSLSLYFLLSTTYFLLSDLLSSPCTRTHSFFSCSTARSFPCEASWTAWRSACVGAFGLVVGVGVGSVTTSCLRGGGGQVGDVMDGWRRRSDWFLSETVGFAAE